MEDQFETLQALLPAYHLGITDPDETALVEALLKKYPEADESYEDIADALLFSVPQREAPPHLLLKLMQETAPPPAKPPSRSKPIIEFSRRERYFLLAIVGMFMALLAFNVYALLQVVELRQDVRNHSQMLSNFANDAVVEFRLIDQRDDGRNAWATVLCNPDERIAVIRVGNFPTDDTYRVWLWRGGEATDGGIITVQAAGDGTIVLEAPQAWGSYQYVSIAPVTKEMDGPVVRGRLY